MTPQELLRSRLIGTLFVERGLVSESQIRVALEIQEETDQQLGEILVERFSVSRAELAQVVAEQWQDDGRAAGPALEASLDENWRRIGEIFVTRGFVTEEELEQALTRQRQTGERLGEALVSLGVISKFELAGALGEQMATVDASAPRAEPRQAEVVQLHAREPVTEATDEPDAAEDAEAHDEAVVEVELEGQTATDVEDTVEEPVIEIEPVELTVEPAEAEPVAMHAVADSEWPEGEYVQPARPRPTLGASDAPVDAEPAPDLRTAPCLAFVSTPGGYVVAPVGREAPEIGEPVDVEGYGGLVVLRHARSPLPDDERTCLVVEASAQPLVYSFA